LGNALLQVEEGYQILLREHVEGLSSLQQLHYASNRYVLLLIFQEMDAGGKDGANGESASANFGLGRLGPRQHLPSDSADVARRKCFAMADRLVQEAEVVGKLDHNERLAVVVSDFYGSYWMAPGQKRPKPEEGREKLGGVLKEAIDWLTGFRPRAG
jgi:hypothetical protein